MGPNYYTQKKEERKIQRLKAQEKLHEEAKKNYRQLVDREKIKIQQSPMKGLNNKFAIHNYNHNRAKSRIMPTFNMDTALNQFKTTKKQKELPESVIMAEITNQDKLFNRQKYFMKQFMEELIKSGINPSKRR